MAAAGRMGGGERELFENQMHEIPKFRGGLLRNMKGGGGDPHLGYLLGKDHDTGPRFGGRETRVRGGRKARSQPAKKSVKSLLRPKGKRPRKALSKHQRNRYQQSGNTTKGGPAGIDHEGDLRPMTSRNYTDQGERGERTGGGQARSIEIITGEQPHAITDQQVPSKIRLKKTDF